MMPFHQHLESQLDIVRARVRLKPEHLQRLALGVADDLGLAATQVLALALVPGAGAQVAEHSKRIVSAKIRMQSGRMGAPARPPAVHAHFPSPATTSDRTLL